jgi:hypothetical protein
MRNKGKNALHFQILDASSLLDMLPTCVISVVL